MNQTKGLCVVGVIFDAPRPSIGSAYIVGSICLMGRLPPALSLWKSFPEPGNSLPWRLIATLGILTPDALPTAAWRELNLDQVAQAGLGSQVVLETRGIFIERLKVGGEHGHGTAVLAEGGAADREGRVFRENRQDARVSASLRDTHFGSPPSSRQQGAGKLVLFRY